VKRKTKLIPLIGLNKLTEEDAERAGRRRESDGASRYNLHFGGRRSVLVYPSAGPHQVPTDQPYAHSASLPPDHAHDCATFYINLFDAQNRLRKDIGTESVQRAIFCD
jgi:hypothetical protein